MRFEVIDRCPVPAPLAAELRFLKAYLGYSEGEEIFASIDRSEEAESILHKYGKSSQAELYSGYVQGLPGFNPANPPGRSTHERRSDGVAFRGPVGRRLRYYKVGIDIRIDVRDRFIAAARKRGWVVTVTYPSNPREQHHLNFRREPVLKVFKPLRVGSRGIRVHRLTRKLRFLRSNKGRPYFTRKPVRRFGRDVEAAVERFQAEHHLVPDGVVGQQTAAQLVVAMRQQRREEDAR